MALVMRWIAVRVLVDQRSFIVRRKSARIGAALAQDFPEIQGFVSALAAVLIA